MLMKHAEEHPAFGVAAVLPRDAPRIAPGRALGGFQKVAKIAKFSKIAKGEGDWVRRSRSVDPLFSTERAISVTAALTPRALPESANPKKSHRVLWCGAVSKSRSRLLAILENLAILAALSEVVHRFASPFVANSIQSRRRELSAVECAPDLPGVAQ